MPYPNTLIFMDLATDDPAAAGNFYAEVFGWVNEGRPTGVFHRLVPGQNFINPDGSQSEIGNFHLGIFNANNARPHPEPKGVEPRVLSDGGRKARLWILVSDDDTPQRILAAARDSVPKSSGAIISGRNSRDSITRFVIPGVMRSYCGARPEKTREYPITTLANRRLHGT